MKIEDIRLTPEEIRAAHSYWNDISDNAVKRVKVVTDTATQKAIEKMIEWVEDRIGIYKVAPQLYSFTMLAVDWQALKELVKK